MSELNPEIKSGSRCALNAIRLPSGENEKLPTLIVSPGVSSFGSGPATVRPAASVFGNSTSHRRVIS